MDQSKSPLFIGSDRITVISEFRIYYLAIEIQIYKQERDQIIKLCKKTTCLPIIYCYGVVLLPNTFEYTHAIFPP